MTTIATLAELRTALGVVGDLSEEEKAFLTLTHPIAEQRVKDYLQYDPVQRTHTEYYPRHLPSGGYLPLRGSWDVNAAHTRAQWEVSNPSYKQDLQLQHLPVRAVTSVHVDLDARHGQQSGAFGSGTEWTSGDDYWVEYDQPNYSPSGMLYSAGSWPFEPGTVKVVYTAGYSEAELCGRATASSSSPYTTVGVDASPIKWAVMLTIQKAFATWSQNRKRARIGFAPGTLASERFQDYAYTMAGATADNLAGMRIQLPAEAVDALSAYAHWGGMRL